MRAQQIPAVDLLGEPPPARRKSASHGEAGYTRNARDAYFTEPWVTRALLAEIDFRKCEGEPYPDLVWEPACGDGRMAKVLSEAGYNVMSSDIHDYGWPGTRIIDFPRHGECWGNAPWAAIITNPPFDLAREFIAKALKLTEPSDGKVAILQRHEFDAPAINRPLFAWPYALKLILPRRPRWSDDDKASPRFPYAWYVWDWRRRGDPVTRWIDDAPSPEALL